MKPELKLLSETRLMGKRLTMTYANNQTVQLWKSFMPHRSQILNMANTDLFSVEVYPNVNFFNSFSPHKEFEKWAAVEVTSFESIPEEMEVYTIPGGSYAVFIYRGKSGEAAEFYRYIYAEWLPKSGYTLADRPHFARMDERYKNNDPTSEEEIWIPIAPK